MTGTAAVPGAVLFDAAGTLISLREPAAATYARVAGHFGVSLPEPRLAEAFGRILRSAPPMVFPDADRGRIPELERAWWRQVVRGTFRAADSAVRFTDFDACFGRLYAHFARPEAWLATPDAAATLTELRVAGHATGVVSNFDCRLPAILEGLGLEELLDVVVLPSDAGCAKPDVRIFALALRRLAATADCTVYVGDDAVLDVAGARAAGLRAIDVATLATLAELPARLADSASDPAGPAEDGGS